MILLPMMSTGSPKTRIPARALRMPHLLFTLACTATCLETPWTYSPGRSKLVVATEVCSPWAATLGRFLFGVRPGTEAIPRP